MNKYIASFSVYLTEGKCLVIIHRCTVKVGVLLMNKYIASCQKLFLTLTLPSLIIIRKKSAPNEFDNQNVP